MNNTINTTVERFISNLLGTELGIEKDIRVTINNSKSIEVLFPRSEEEDILNPENIVKLSDTANMFMREHFEISPYESIAINTAYYSEDTGTKGYEMVLKNITNRLIAYAHRKVENPKVCVKTRLDNNLLEIEFLHDGNINVTSTELRGVVLEALDSVKDFSYDLILIVINIGVEEFK